MLKLEKEKRAVTLAAVFLAFGSGLGGAGFYGLKEDNRMNEVKTVYGCHYR